mmetsp:Transcript_27666/g.64874  ORF Transcript_27666/g.64874 Transcript_27666/m.64874 type:complete len:234 (-) Transcript_27666:855-1556(-)
MGSLSCQPVHPGPGRFTARRRSVALRAVVVHRTHMFKLSVGYGDAAPAPVEEAGQQQRVVWLVTSSTAQRRPGNLLSAELLCRRRRAQPVQSLELGEEMAVCLGACRRAQPLQPPRLERVDKGADPRRQVVQRLALREVGDAAEAREVVRQEGHGTQCTHLHALVERQHRARPVRGQFAETAECARGEGTAVVESYLAVREPRPRALVLICERGHLCCRDEHPSRVPEGELCK